MMIAAGTLRRKMIIEQKVKTPDDAGGNVVTWQTFCTVYADLEPANGREVYAQGQVRGDVTHHITIRFRTGIKRNMRVNYNGRYFNIRDVVDVGEAHRKLVLLAEELQADTA